MSWNGQTALGIIVQLPRSTWVKAWAQHVYKRGMDPVPEFLDIGPVCHPRDKYSWRGAK